MAKKFKTEHSFKEITFDEVVDFLEENGTDADKKNFKNACFTNKDGKAVDKLNWLNGKKWFCGEFAPELLPVKKEKEEPKSKRIAEW